MPLDFSVLGPDGSPSMVVSIRAAVHARVIDIGNEVGTPQLLRASDFYADVDYSSSDVAVLRGEVIALQNAVVDDPELAAVLAQLDELLLHASDQRAGISAIAD